MESRFTFIVSDDSLNKYGTRVLTAGIDTTEFERNPVMFWNHKRDDEFTNANRFPIGRWENLRKDGERLLADAVLDLNDTTGSKVAQKLSDKFLNACSIGIEIVEYSDDVDVILMGQTMPTITKSKLMEISIVDIPANDNALKLSYPTQNATACFSFDELGNNLQQILPTMDNPKTVGEQMTASLNSFFERFKASFNITPKEGVEDAEKAQETMFAEFNATIKAIEMPEMPDNSPQIEELKAAIDVLTFGAAEQTKTVADLTSQLVELRGQKSGGATKKDAAPMGAIDEKETELSAMDKQFAAFGQLFTNKLKNR